MRNPSSPKAPKFKLRRHFPLVGLTNTASRPNLPGHNTPRQLPRMTWNSPRLEEKGKNKWTTPGPARFSSSSNDADATTRQASSSAKSQDKKSHDKKSPSAAKIGGDLESLQDTMKGPLDALIESEALAAGGFGDPMAGPQLNLAGAKSSNSAAS